MKCTIPEISWHNTEPVFSVDIYLENDQFYRLASGGGDCHVLIWQLNIAQTGAVNQNLICDLTTHQRSVNCVKWSNCGKYLASGDDDANIIIWKLKKDSASLLEGDNDDKETWIVHKILRGHKEDVYDICWSVDSSKILSGSIDNTAILWDIKNGKMDHILSDHKGFVQGVAWDPQNQFIATISTDRVCRLFDTVGKKVKARIHKGKISAVPEGHFLRDKEVKYFHDDTFKSFFRRLKFTPDGSLLIVPSGYLETESCKTALNATLVFTMDEFNSPAAILPIPRHSSTVVCCCSILFELRENGPDPVINLPYRMIFAVGTDHNIILYDTQQKSPIARFQDIHYTRLTDLCWSQDGLLLIASSTDGFCSLITFKLDELGVPWKQANSECEENSIDVSERA
ncbi:chromatin assembly factor 1 subunit B [Euwallacea fornicatus]|uniref:chromatin assembly factor 1 subunit B n=1 Tax=Euwallacea fornicatus TaxID=995702 RepID=UPI00338E5D89